MNSLSFIIIFTLCYFIYRKKNIRKREIALILVASSVVIGCDYFREFIANLRNIFGGNVSTYESIMDRGRREALLRIREQALKQDANIVVNIKLETIILDPLGSKKHPKICLTAYGTAIKYA